MSTVRRIPLTVAILLALLLSGLTLVAGSNDPADAAQVGDCTSGLYDGDFCLIVGDPPVAGEPLCPTSTVVFESNGSCYSMLSPNPLPSCEGDYRLAPDGVSCWLFLLIDGTQPGTFCPSVVNAGGLLIGEGFPTGLHCYYDLPAPGPACPSAADLGLVNGQCRRSVIDVPGPLTCPDPAFLLFEADGLCLAYEVCPNLAVPVSSPDACVLALPAPQAPDTCPGEARGTVGGCYVLVALGSTEVCPGESDEPSSTGSCQEIAPVASGPAGCTPIGDWCVLETDPVVVPRCPDGSFEDADGFCRRPIANAPGFYSCPDGEGQLAGKFCEYIVDRLGELTTRCPTGWFGPTRAVNNWCAAATPAIANPDFCPDNATELPGRGCFAEVERVAGWLCAEGAVKGDYCWINAESPTPGPGECPVSSVVFENEFGMCYSVVSPNPEGSPLPCPLIADLGLIDGQCRKNVQLAPGDAVCAEGALIAGVQCIVAVPATPGDACPYEAELGDGGACLVEVDPAPALLCADAQAVLSGSDCLLARPALGDANCDGSVDLQDARLAAQLAIGARFSTDVCPLEFPVTQAHAPSANVDEADETSLRDARHIAQCAIGVTVADLCG